EHYIRPFDAEPAALLDALDFFKLGFHAREQPADAAELVEHRRIERHYRRTFGDAVAFENAQAEFFQIDLARRLFHRLRAGEHVAQRAEIVRVGDPRITVEERTGAEERGGAGPV